MVNLGPFQAVMSKNIILILFAGGLIIFGNIIFKKFEKWLKKKK